MDKKHELSNYGGRTRKLLDSARSGKMDGWKLDFQLANGLNCWKIRDDRSGLVITTYQCGGHVKIVDDRLRDLTAVA